MTDTPATAIERMSRLERAMERVRWFGIALGFYQIFWYVPTPGTTIPPSVRPVGGAALALLLIVNVIVGRFLRRPTETGLRRLGAVAFAADMAAVWTLVWAFNFEEFGATWVILTIPPLEGALRYQMRGAMLPVALAIPVETAREIFRIFAFEDFHEYEASSYVSGVTFRVGLVVMIAAVAGAIARNLERERSHAEERAVQLAELAQKETAARSESSAFQKVILAGVSARTLPEALESMLAHIAADLGYGHIAVLMREENGGLRAVAFQGFPPSARDAKVEPGEGIAGWVAQTGRTAVIPDVSQDDRYIAVEPSTRSQVTLPIRIGDEILGVLDVESSRIDAFDATDVARLERLSAQMALVIENGRLLARERATVERLRELDGMKSDFIAIASHELRTPITAMQGSIKTLLRRDLHLEAGQTYELLEILERQSDRLTRLVEDLLMVSRIDASPVGLRMDEVSLPGLFRDLIAEIGPGAQRVSVAIAPELERVLTDGARLGQVLRNLVDNGLKFAPEDTVVRVSVHGDHDRAVFEVADDGPGMDAEDITYIFDRFHQVGGSLRRRSEGIGLGLYITKRLVEALGGTIEVDSTIGVGTTFRVRIPVGGVEKELDALG